MATDLNIRIPEQLRQAVENAAQADGKSVNDLAIEALQRHLAQRTLERFRRQGDIRRRGMTEADVDAAVEHAVNEVRGR